MADGEFGAAAFVAEVAHGGGVATAEAGGESGGADGAGPAAVAIGFVFPVPAGGGGEPDFHFDVGIGGGAQGGGYAAEGGEIGEGCAAARVGGRESARGDIDGGGDGPAGEFEGGQAFAGHGVGEGGAQKEREGADWKRCVHRIRVYTFANSVRLWLLDVVDHQRVHDCLLRDKLQSELVLDNGLVVLFRHGPQGKEIGSRETRLIEDRPVNSDHSADGVRPVAVHPVHKGRHVCDGCIVRAAGELALQRRAGCLRITSLLPFAKLRAAFAYDKNVNRHLLLRVTQYEVKPLVEKGPKHSSQL